MDKLDMQTKNLADENYAALVKMFPNAITETITGYDEDGKAIVERAIDADVLRQEISATVVEGRDERYQFTWPDKKKTITIANASVNLSLRPCREESLNFDNTKNLYIQGDNLDVLKLLQETYLEKVKLIYIDPPYNTGNDFIYDDDYAMEWEQYASDSGQYDGYGNRLVQNIESNGRFHTDWLNVIYARIKLARNLLTDDGVIFISIDEHEVENLTKICDEIFGITNHVGTIVVKSNPRGSMSTAEIAGLHEYLLVYSKNRQNVSIIGHELNDDMTAEYKYSDDKGMYRLLGLRMRGGFWRRAERPNLYYPIYINPQNGNVSLEKDDKYSAEALPIQPSTMEDGTWRWSRDKIKTDIKSLIGRQVKRNQEMVWDVFQKDYYDRENGRRTKAKSIWEESEINYQNGTAEIKSLLGNSGVFNYSKPVFLVEQILKMIGLNDDDIIMDFFSGSATTAHAVLKLNSESNSKLNYIMVQLPEDISEKSEAYKSGYRNICEIGKERIRQAVKRIKDELNADIDYGFRVLKVDSSNMKDVYYNPSAIQQMSLDMYTDNIKEDRTPKDLLFQVMLDLGVMLSEKIEEIEIAGKKVFNVGNGFLLACFDKEISDDTVNEIAKMQPIYAVFRDNSMASDSVANNFDQIFESYSPQTIRKVL